MGCLTSQPDSVSGTRTRNPATQGTNKLDSSASPQAIAAPPSGDSDENFEFLSQSHYDRHMQERQADQMFFQNILQSTENKIIDIASTSMVPIAPEDARERKSEYLSVLANWQVRRYDSSDPKSPFALPTPSGDGFVTLSALSGSGHGALPDPQHLQILQLVEDDFKNKSKPSVINPTTVILDPYVLFA